MTLKVLLQKLFIGGKWYVGYRDIKLTNGRKYHIVDVPIGQWIADPFMYEYGGMHYLFVEQYFEDKGRAGIGFFQFENGVPTNNQVIIENDYHMSYPCVFNHKGKHYIIPESSANNTIDLYVAESFPSSWSHKATLLQGEKYVDSTVYQNGDEVYLLSYKKEDSIWKLVLFGLDVEECKLNKITEVVFTKNTGRPAGFLYFDKKLYRPAQDCSRKYGEALIINEVDKICSNGYKEHSVSKILCSDIKCSENIQRIHTLNNDSQYEVVDLFQEKFDLLHTWKILKRAYL